MRLACGAAGEDETRVMAEMDSSIGFDVSFGMDNVEESGWRRDALVERFGVDVKGTWIWKESRLGRNAEPSVDMIMFCCLLP